MARHNAQRVFRLRGYDYSQDGSYFVTLNADRGRHIFGRVRDGKLLPSGIGSIVEADWRDIPHHYQNVRLDEFCVMPNHFHGIVTILRTDPYVQRQGVARRFGPPVRGTLSSIVGVFKSGVTWKARQANLWGKAPLWRARFHDSVVRSDKDLYRIRRYIELNPLLWTYRRGKGDLSSDALNELERRLKEEFGIDGRSAYEVLTSEKVLGREARD
jgi:REP element-mobilizing transposase RayT